MSRTIIEIGNIKIYWYSVIMLVAILLGIFLSTKESKKQGLESFISDLLFKLVIYGIIGARLYYVIFNFSEYQNNLLAILKIWEGGLAIYGAIIAGIIVIIVESKKREINLLKITDIIVPSLILGQSIGRWGNFFNQEAHGGLTTLEQLKSLYIPEFIIEGMKINNNYYQPTFYYESLWCLVGFIIIIIVRQIIRKKENKQGLLTSIYYIWYGLGRFIIEGMRTDSLYLGSLRISQIVSLMLFIIGIIGIIIILIKSNKKNGGINETRI